MIAFQNKPYHCHNRAPFKTEQVLRPIHVHLGVVRAGKPVVIPFRNTTDCQYTLSDLGQIDPGCDGCKWRHDAIPV